MCIRDSIPHARRLLDRRVLGRRRRPRRQLCAQLGQVSVQPRARQQGEEGLRRVICRVERVLVVVVLRERHRRRQLQQPLLGRAEGAALLERVVRRLLPLAQCGLAQLDRRIWPIEPAAERAQRRLEVDVRPAARAAARPELREPQAVGAGERRDLADHRLRPLARARAVHLQRRQHDLGVVVQLLAKPVQRGLERRLGRRRALGGRRRDVAPQLRDLLPLELQVELERASVVVLLHVELALQLHDRANQRHGALMRRSHRRLALRRLLAPQHAELPARDEEAAHEDEQ
eukprot:5655415-Prymnesium_polylepis.1